MDLAKEALEREQALLDTQKKQFEEEELALLVEQERLNALLDIQPTQSEEKQEQRLAEINRIQELIDSQRTKFEEEELALQEKLARQIEQFAKIDKLWECPISYGRLRKPVITNDGHCYEREKIEEWFETNNTSPLTGATLNDKRMISVPILNEFLAKLKEFVHLGFVNIGD